MSVVASITPAGNGSWKWVVEWDGRVKGQGVECCEADARRNAIGRIEWLACAAAFADDEATERACADALAAVAFGDEQEPGSFNSEAKKLSDAPGSQQELSHDTCPTCGTPVHVVGGDEGTSHYEPA